MQKNQGFTLIELAMVILIIGVLAAIAYPSYQDYVVRTKRVEMMTEIQNIANMLESRKLAAGRGGYTKVKTDGLIGGYPKSGTALYTVAITGVGAGGDGRWTITARPIAQATQAKDGALTLNYLGQRCRANKCGMGKEWNE